MARRSAVAVLTASALLGGGVYAATAAGSPVTVLGLTGTGDCDEQLAASSATRAQARALLTDLIVSDDPDAHALAGKISEIGFAPASQPDGWRQHAVDTSDQLHRLGSTDPQVQQLGVRLAAAGLGPTPPTCSPTGPGRRAVPDHSTAVTCCLHRNRHTGTDHSAPDHDPQHAGQRRRPGPQHPPDDRSCRDPDLDPARRLRSRLGGRAGHRRCRGIGDENDDEPADASTAPPAPPPRRALNRLTAGKHRSGHRQRWRTLPPPGRRWAWSAT